MHYQNNRTITKKDIEFLRKLEIRLQSQASEKTKNIKDKNLISRREFQNFWEILDKIECNFDKTKEKSRETSREKRKLDKTYGRPYYYKQYIKDKEQAKKSNIKFTKTINDYKQMYDAKK